MLMKYELEILRNWYLEMMLEHKIKNYFGSMNIEMDICLNFSKIFQKIELEENLYLKLESEKQQKYIFMSDVYNPREILKKIYFSSIKD